MDGKQAIQRIKDMVEKCKYSTMHNVKYVAFVCEDGVSVTMENCNTIWKWWLVEGQQPKLQEIKHKPKNKKQKKVESMAFDEYQMPQLKGVKNVKNRKRLCSAY